MLLSRPKTALTGAGEVENHVSALEESTARIKKETAVKVNSKRTLSTLPSN